MKPSIWFMISNSSLLTAEGISAAIFLVIVATIIGGGLIAILAGRLIRSVCGLAICFIGVAGLYYYLQSPFVALMEMLIYVGAVCVVIAFAIMLADPTATGGGKSGPLTALLGVVVALPIFWGLMSLTSKTEWHAPAKRLSDGSMEAIGRHLLTTYSMVFELISVVLLVAILGSLVVARAGRGK